MSFWQFLRAFYSSDDAGKKQRVTDLKGPDSNPYLALSGWDESEDSGRPGRFLGGAAGAGRAAGAWPPT